MRVALTGTPGTGKSSIAEFLAGDFGLEVIEVNRYAEQNELIRGRDRERDTAIVDIDAVESQLSGKSDVLFDGHLSHKLDVDYVVVLRCNPEVLYDRLIGRGESQDKSRENAEAEALDIVLAEAIDTNDWIHEIDTTEKEPGEAAEEIIEAIREDEPSMGVAGWGEYLEGFK